MIKFNLWIELITNQMYFILFHTKGTIFQFHSIKFLHLKHWLSKGILDSKLFLHKEAKSRSEPHLRHYKDILPFLKELLYLLLLILIKIINLTKLRII